MSRNRWQEKARNQARVNGREYVGKELKPEGRTIDKLINATLSAASGIDAAASPANYVRATSIQAGKRLKGEFRTIASVEEIKQGKGFMSTFVRQRHSEP